jgi:WbqC-like protein family
MPLLTELHYLPNTAYFVELLKHNEIYIESQEHYQKQSYRNRCQILTANGLIELVVPVVHTNDKVLIRDARIDNTQNWPQKHWRTLTTAYSKAPFFEHFAPYFEKIYEQKNTFLFDFNLELLTLCLKLLQFSPTICLTESYSNIAPNGQIDRRNENHPKKQTNLIEFQRFKSYQHNFGSEFVPNLSIIDLLMCRGTQAKQIICESTGVF